MPYRSRLAITQPMPLAMSSCRMREALPTFTSTRPRSGASEAYFPPESRPFPAATTLDIIPCQLDTSGCCSGSGPERPPTRST
jgi:hypothetical protein